MQMLNVRGFVDNSTALVDLTSDLPHGLRGGSSLPPTSAVYHPTTKALLHEFDLRLGGHDPYTQGHCRRVGILVDGLARVLGWNESDRESAYLGGRLHDIGKLFIEPEVLGKAGPLTTEERTRMHQHPQRGATLVINRVPFDTYYGLLDHHERIDGNQHHQCFPAYPSGKQGHSIHPLGRCIAICDSFDAMTSARQYRLDAPQGLSRETAIRRLQQDAGRMYDPDMLEAFVDEVAPHVCLTGCEGGWQLAQVPLGVAA